MSYITVMGEAEAIKNLTAFQLVSTHLYPVPSLRMSGTVSPLISHTLMACKWTYVLAVDIVQ